MPESWAWLSRSEGRPLPPTAARGDAFAPVFVLGIVTGGLAFVAALARFRVARATGIGLR